MSDIIDLTFADLEADEDYASVCAEYVGDRDMKPAAKTGKQQVPVVFVEIILFPLINQIILTSVMHSPFCKSGGRS